MDGCIIGIFSEVGYNAGTVPYTTINLKVKGQYTLTQFIYRFVLLCNYNSLFIKLIKLIAHVRILHQMHKQKN